VYPKSKKKHEPQKTPKPERNPKNLKKNSKPERNPKKSKRNPFTKSDGHPNPIRNPTGSSSGAKFNLTIFFIDRVFGRSDLNPTCCHPYACLPFIHEDEADNNVHE
jgi:hypothetical protein